MAHRRKTLAALSTAVTICWGLSAAPAALADASPATTVRTAASVAPSVLAYDPANTLGLPGDTHELMVWSFQEYEAYDIPAPNLTATLNSYTCGPHHPTQTPRDLGCAFAAAQERVQVLDPRIDVLGTGAVRVRGVVAGQRFDLAMTGTAATHPFVHTWRHATGTRRETGRTTTADHTGAQVVGTFGGVPVAPFPYALQEFRTYTSTVRTGSGPAVPVPDLRRDDAPLSTWLTATWTRSLPRTGPTGTRDVEAGRFWARQDPSGTSVLPTISDQRCAPGEVISVAEPGIGTCAVMATASWSADPRVAVDLATGSARVVVRQTLTAEPGYPDPPDPDRVLDFTWRGSGRQGFLDLDVVTWSDGRISTRTRAGIHWAAVAFSGTVDRADLDQISGVGFQAYRETRSEG